jgi:hypothetical protein
MKKSHHPFSICLVFCALVFLPQALRAETEPNNTPATANVLAINSSESGRVGDSTAPGQFDTYDWYSVTVPSDGRLKVLATGSGTNFDLNIYMYRMPDSMTIPNPHGDWFGASGDGVHDTLMDDLHACTVWIQVVALAGKGSYTITSVFEPAGLANDQENNDTPVVAQTLTLNSSTTGHMGYHSYALGIDTYDWFKVTTPSDGRLTFTSATSSGNLAIQLFIYRSVTDMKNINSSGDYIGSPTADPVNDTVSDRLKAGTYYLQVIKRSGVGSYTLETDFAPAALANDAENDDTPCVAINLPVNGSLTGHLGYYSNAMGYDTYDWYKVAVPAEGKLTVTTKTSDGDLDLQPYIYRSVDDMKNVNSGGDYVGSTNAQVDDTVIDYLRPCTVFVEIIRRAGIGSYTISSSFVPADQPADQELDDIPNQAEVIPLDSTRSGHLGYYSHALGTDDFDWYKITVTTAQTLTFRSLVTEGNLDFQLYLYKTVGDMTTQNPGGDYVGGGGTQSRDTASADVVAGTYYLQVERRSGLGSYIIACGTAVITVAVKQPSLPQSYGAKKKIPTIAFVKSSVSSSSGVTMVTYGVPISSDVVLELYSMNGRNIARIAKPGLAAGIYEEHFTGMTLPAGIYCCRLRIGNAVLSSIMRFTRQ